MTCRICGARNEQPHRPFCTLAEKPDAELAHLPLNVKRSDGLLVGSLHWTEWSGGRKGWRFFPKFQAQPSRKLHPSPQDAMRHYRLEGCTLEVAS